MDKIEQYREYVQKVLLDYAEFRKPTRPDDELALQAIMVSATRLKYLGCGQVQVRKGGRN